MGVDWTDDALLEEFARQKGEDKSNFSISAEGSAGDEDMPGQEGNIGVAVKRGRTDGGADLKGFYFASQFENKVCVGYCWRKYCICPDYGAFVYLKTGFVTKGDLLTVPNDQSNECFTSANGDRCIYGHEIRYSIMKGHKECKGLV